MHTRTLARAVLALVAYACIPFIASPASAVTLCSSACTPIISPPPSPIVVATDPIEVDLPPLVITGLGVGDGAPGAILDIFGADVVIHAPPSGTITAPSVDLRAGGDIRLFTAPGDSGTFAVLESISLCSSSDCNPFPEPDTKLYYEGDVVFHLSLNGPLTGPLRIFSTGEIRVTSDPYPALVPEPGTGLLVGLGLLLVTVPRKRD